MTESFTIDGPCGKLSAVLERPSASMEKGDPLVVFCHGIMDTKDAAIGVTLSEKLLETGIASLRFDFDGHGESEGPTYGMTVLTEIDDLKAVIEYTRSLEWVSAVALCGHSLGGVVAAMTAGQVGFPSVKALLLYAPAGKIKEDAWRGYVVGGGFDPDNIPEKMPLLGDFLLGRDYITTARELPIHETAAMYKGPCCIIHGTKDFIVRPEVGEKFHDVIQGSEFRLIEGGRHDFLSCLEEASIMGAEWLKDKI